MSDDPIGTSICRRKRKSGPREHLGFQMLNASTSLFRRLARLDANSLPVSRAYVSPGSHTYQKYHRPLTAVGQTLGGSYWFSLRPAFNFSATMDRSCCGSRTSACPDHASSHCRFLRDRLVATRSVS